MGATFCMYYCITAFSVSLNLFSPKTKRYFSSKVDGRNGFGIEAVNKMSDDALEEVFVLILVH
jgi:hypothetical protein